jgi:hypothetical protein
VKTKVKKGKQGFDFNIYFSILLTSFFLWSRMYIREEKSYIAMVQVEVNQLIQKKEKSHIVGIR